MNGPQAYSKLMSTLQAQGCTPSRQILYLFSGGYMPGMQLLQSVGAALFSSFYLVDIWIGSNSGVQNFYKGLADGHAANITYVYTEFAANNDEVRDYIAKKVGPQRAILVGGTTMKDHMSTNTMAVTQLSRWQAFC